MLELETRNSRIGVRTKSAAMDIQALNGINRNPRGNVFCLAMLFTFFPFETTTSLTFNLTSFSNPPQRKLDLLANGIRIQHEKFSIPSPNAVFEIVPKKGWARK